MSEGRLTDRKAVYIALVLARDYELQLIDAHKGLENFETHETVIHCRRRIAAFERVMNRYFGGLPADPLKGTKLVDAMTMLRGKDRP